MNRSLKMRKWGVVISCGIALLIAAVVAVVFASRNRQQPAPPPDVPVAALPAEVRVKAVERKPEPLDHELGGDRPHGTLIFQGFPDIGLATTPILAAFAGFSLAVTP